MISRGFRSIGHDRRRRVSKRHDHKQVNSIRHGQKRRGAVVVLIAVMLPVLIAFTALTVDVGVMYNARADLQRAADAAAISAAGLLSSRNGDPMSLARHTAKEIVSRNPVMGKTVTVDDADITFGHAVFQSGTSQFDFVPSTNLPDAVRVVVRKTEGSPNGPLSLFFASIFGKKMTDVKAEAVAMLIPRDIALVADLSRSHNYDSTISMYRNTAINLFDVWGGFPGGIDDGADSIWTGDDPATLGAAELAQRSGPAWGLMKELGFGDLTLGSNYDPNSDPGLIKLASGQNWSDARMTQYLTNQGYSANEITAILSGSSDNNGGYEARVAVALGLARWDSGIAGGLWETIGVSASQAGNGNAAISSGEITFVEKFGDRSYSESADIFNDYIRNYVKSSRSSMANANSRFQYQYGVKTFVDYLMNNRPLFTDTPELANAPHQPMQAVKDAVNQLASTVAALNSNDRISLEVYATYARHEVDLTNDFFAVAETLNGMQAGHYAPNTNIGAGILRGIEELTGSHASPVAKKSMILLTDGVANIGCETCTSFDPAGGQAYALQMAQQAADAGIRIFTVSVGSDSDSALMDQIASIGSGGHYHAEGTIDQYSVQLDEIFQILGGARTVELIR